MEPLVGVIFKRVFYWPAVHLVVIAPVPECVAETDIYLVFGEALTLDRVYVDKSHSGEGANGKPLWKLCASPQTRWQIKKKSYPILGEGR